jgi:hypothetical protein
MVLKNSRLQVRNPMLLRIAQRKQKIARFVPRPIDLSSSTSLEWRTIGCGAVRNQSAHGKLQGGCRWDIFCLVCFRWDNPSRHSILYDYFSEIRQFSSSAALENISMSNIKQWNSTAWADCSAGKHRESKFGLFTPTLPSCCFGRIGEIRQI